MSKNIILEKLEGIEKRFLEIEGLISQPEIIADQKKFVKLNKEYRELEPLVAAFKEYKDILSNITTSKEILSEEKDDEMRQMAKMELEELEEKKTDSGITVKDSIMDVIAKLGEKITIGQFKRINFNKETTRYYSYIHGDGK